MGRTFYDVLGVSRSATQEEIETAYRDRLKETHPDVSDDERAGETVKAVIEAGDVLTDAAERERYDRLGHEAYVSVTDRFDPTHVSRGPTAEQEPDDRGTEQPAEAQSPTEGESGRVRAETGADGGSVRWGDPNTANANPDGVDWVGGSQRAPTDEPGRSRTSFSSKSEQSVLFLLSLFGYPILVMASVFPPFPLVFRVIIAACTIALVVYLVTVPRVSAPAFGFWTAVVAGAVVFDAIAFPSPVSLGAVIVTGAPFGLSLFVLSLRL